ncbi:MAG: AAA family ATPase [Firmicutes bacterium]|nr:AAA family ATPase [Bacillota bacterium]
MDNLGKEILKLTNENPDMARALDLPDKPQKQVKKAAFVCLADIEPESVQWLWRPYIPKGKITLLEGDPAAGKTFIALAIATAVSTGAPFPDSNTGRPWERRAPGTVIYLTAEDGIGDTLRPRLDAMGANVANVYAMTGTTDGEREDSFSFSDLALLEGLAVTLQPQLIVVDPLQAFLGAGVDMHRANETRPILSKLAALAEHNGCAILLLRHLSKGGTTKAIYRGMGSIDFTAAARSVLLAGCDPQDQTIRALAHIKSSLAPTGRTQGYKLADGFFWTGISEMTAGAMFGSEIATGERESKLDDAADWLRAQLNDGPQEKRDLEESAEIKGFSKRTLRRAAEELSIKSYKRPGEKNGPYVWELPGNNFQSGVDQSHESVQTPTMANPSTREKTKNGAGSTGWPNKNDGQPVDGSNGAENDEYDILLQFDTYISHPEEENNVINPFANYVNNRNY